MRDDTLILFGRTTIIEKLDKILEKLDENS